MPNDDTIKLLKECDAGAKMGIDGINRVIYFRKIFKRSRKFGRKDTR